MTNPSTSKWRRRSEAEWHQIIEGHASSGLSQAAYCQTQGISIASFHKWKQHFATDAPAPLMHSNWLDISSVASPVSASPKTDGWEIELDLGHGLQLRLRRC